MSLSGVNRLILSEETAKGGNVFENSAKKIMGEANKAAISIKKIEIKNKPKY